MKARKPVIATVVNRGAAWASRGVTAGANKKASVRAKAKGIRRSRAKKSTRAVTGSAKKGPTLENSVLRARAIRPRRAVIDQTCPNWWWEPLHLCRERAL